MKQRRRLATAAATTTSPPPPESPRLFSPSPSTHAFFLFFLLFRLLNALLVQTQFDPDEFWQANEPAHLVVFGVGHLTWEWDAAIRGWLHPLLLTPPLFLLKWTGLDNPLAVMLAPRIGVQAILMAWADTSICELAQKLGGSVYWARILALTNWFWFYCGIRTYSNSVEACVLIIVLNSWWDGRAPPSRFVLILASLCVAIRPSALLSFAFLGAWYAADKLHKAAFWHQVFCEFAPIIILCLACTTVLDSYMYDRLVCTPFNFFHVNLVRNVSVLYGTHAWYWYLVACFPAILGAHFPAFCWSVLYDDGGGENVRRLLGLIAWNLGVLSLAPHKELRFALPCVPLALVVTSIGLKRVRRGTMRPALTLCFIVLGAAPALYLSLVHQRAPIDVALYLGSALPPSSVVDVLLPCHSIPHYAVIHTALNEVRFLDCTPHTMMRPGSRLTPHNETYLFQNNTTVFLQNRYQNGLRPNTIVTYPEYVDVINKQFGKAPNHQAVRAFPHGQDGKTILVLSI